MSDVNRVILIGRLTADPEVKPVGQSMLCKFRIAMSEKWTTSDGEKKSATTYVDVNQWGRSANACGDYLRKGSRVCVEGSLALDEWEKDGQKRSKLYVKSRNVQFLDPKGEGS